MWHRPSIPKINTQPLLHLQGNGNKNRTPNNWYYSFFLILGYLEEGEWKRAEGEKHFGFQQTFGNPVNYRYSGLKGAAEIQSLGSQRDWATFTPSLGSFPTEIKKINKWKASLSRQDWSPPATRSGFSYPKQRWWCDAPCPKIAKIWGNIILQCSFCLITACDKPNRYFCCLGPKISDLGLSPSLQPYYHYAYYYCTFK